MTLKRLFPLMAPLALCGMLWSCSDSVSGSSIVPTVTRVDTAAGKAPVFYWRTTDGAEHSLLDYRGKVVLLNFWATWCGPCVSEIPNIRQVRADSLGTGFEVIGLSVDNRTPDGSTVPNYVASFVNHNNMPYPVVIATDDVLLAYGGISAIPVSVLIGPSGAISETLVGAKSQTVFRDAIGRARNR